MASGHLRGENPDVLITEPEPWHVDVTMHRTNSRAWLLALGPHGLKQPRCEKCFKPCSGRVSSLGPNQ